MSTIIFRADSSSEIGMGHVYRLISLIKYLHLEYRCLFFTNNINRQLSEDLKGIHVEIHEVEKKYEYTIPSHRKIKSEISFDLDKIITGDEIVVLDGYWFGYNYQKSVRAAGAKLIVIDDFATGLFHADIIINHAPAICKKKYIALSSTRFLLGPNFSIIRPSFLALAKRKNVIRKVEKSIIICFGGSDFFDYTNMILETVCKIGLFETISVVVSHSYNGVENLKQKYGDTISLYCSVSEKEIADLMSLSETAIVPASTVLYEAVAAQCKVITGFYTENQRMIYEGFISAGAVIGCGDFKKIASNFIELYKNALALHSHDRIIDGLSDLRIKKALSNLAFPKNEDSIIDK